MRRCGYEVRIGRGGRAACGWCPLSEWGFCTGGEAGREVAGGRSWLGRGAGRGKEGGGGPRHGLPQQPPFPYTTLLPLGMANRMRSHMRMDSQSQSHALSRSGCALQRSCLSSLAAGQTGGGVALAI